MPQRYSKKPILQGGKIMSSNGGVIRLDSSQRMVENTPVKVKIKLQATDYNYGNLPQEETKELEKLAAIVDHHQLTVRKTTGESVLEIGKVLEQAQSLLAQKGCNGLFKGWVKDRCGFSLRSAYNAINAYNRFKGVKTKVSLLDVTAMYLLSNKSCPDKAIDEVIKLLQGDKRVTYTQAKELVGRYTIKTVRQFNQKRTRKQVEKTIGRLVSHYAVKHQPFILKVIYRQYQAMKLELRVRPKKVA